MARVAATPRMPCLVCLELTAIRADRDASGVAATNTGRVAAKPQMPYLGCSEPTNTARQSEARRFSPEGKASLTEMPINGLPADSKLLGD